MEKVHSDKEVLNFDEFQNGDEITFEVGEPGFEFSNLSEGSIAAINKLTPGTKVKVVKIAPGKFEVWA